MATGEAWNAGQLPPGARIVSVADTAPAAPPGWKLVPLEPTNKMLAAGQMAWTRDPLRKSSTLYRAMVEAAPPYDSRPPCTVCGKPWAEHGSYPTCATHPYTPNGAPSPHTQELPLV